MKTLITAALSLGLLLPVPATAPPVPSSTTDVPVVVVEPAASSKKKSTTVKPREGSRWFVCYLHGNRRCGNGIYA